MGPLMSSSSFCSSLSSSFDHAEHQLTGMTSGPLFVVGLIVWPAVLGSCMSGSTVPPGVSSGRFESDSLSLVVG